MFWRFGFNTPSAIDGLLDREDVTLEEVLCDQDIIQEAKSQNTKLIDFLLKPENLEELIQLFFSLGSDKQRLSLIACEILSCEIPQLTDALVLEHKDLLEKFWSFLDVPFSSDVGFAYQSSYFCKIITIFLSKDTVEMLDFIKSTPENLIKILCHLQSPAIMDLLISLVRLEELPEAKGIVKWLSDNGLLLNLINRLDPNLDNDEHATAQQCICEIVRLSQTSLLDSPSIGMNDFVLELTSKEMMQKLADFMLDPNAPNSTSTLIHGVAIIIDIIRHNNGDIENETGLVTVMSYQNQLARPPVVSLTDMLQVMTDNIHRFNDLLIKPRQKGPIMPATPLGFERLKICELFAELLHCSNMSNLNFTEEQEQKEETDGDRLKLKFVQEKVLPTCIDLFFDFPWNNFLHYVVYDMLHQVFNGRMDRESNRQLATTIFTQGHLTDKIVEAQKKNDEECAKPKGMRLGYMGHLTFISDEIIKLFEGYPESIISAIESSINLEDWNEYCNNQLRETKERDSMPLGDIRLNGINPIVHSNGEEEEDDDELDATNHALGMFSHIGTLVEEEENGEEENGEEESGEEDTEIEIESWISGRDDFQFGDSYESDNGPHRGTVVHNMLDDSDEEDEEDEEREIESWIRGRNDLSFVEEYIDSDEEAPENAADDDDDLTNGNTHYSSDEEEEESSKQAVNWSNGFGQYSQRNELQRTHSHNNDNNTSTANEEYVDEDEEDPFGDFAASTDEPDQWEDAFSAGFSDTKNDAANNEQPDQFEDAFSTSASNTKTNHVEKDEFQDVFSSNFSDSKVEPVENGAVNSEQKDQTSQADTISPSSLDDKIDTVKHEHKEEQSKDVGFSTSKETDTESKPDQFEDAFSSNFTKVNPNMSEPSGGFSSNFSDMKIDTTKENTIKNENKDQSPPVCS